MEVMLQASSRVSLPQEIVGGSLLAMQASENLAGFLRLVPQERGAALGFKPGCDAKAETLTLTWGSCCSGSEGAHYVVEAVNLALQQQDIPLCFKHSFSCEINPKKREWIKTVLSSGHVFAGSLSESDPQGRPWHELGCVFTDILDLKEGEAPCAMHSPGRRRKGKLEHLPCAVPSVDVLVIGTSCKDLSRANSSVDRTKLVLSEETSKGASAQTFKGMLGYVSGHRPRFVIFENVDSIDDKVSTAQETNLSLVMQAMKELGYEGQKVMTDAQQFGLPCRRRRLYVLFLDVASPRLDLRGEALGQVFALFRKLVASCLRTPPSVKDCLLTEDAHGQDLREAVQDRHAMWEKAQEKKPAPQTWLDKHMAYADQLGVRWAAPVAEGLAANVWYQTLTKREQDALVLSRVDGPDCLFRNLSQSIGRINARSTAKDYEDGREIAPTMLPGQILWVESQERVLTGEEALLLQGFPILRLKNKCLTLPPDLASQAFLSDLAGNAMALPVVLAIFQAGLAAVRWREGRDTDEEEGELAVAMAALAKLQSNDGRGRA